MKSIFIVSLMLCSLSLQAKRTTVVYCSEASPSTLYGALGSDMTSHIVNAHMVDALFRYKTGTTELVPNLLEEFSISKDGLIYQMKLKKGVQFHSAFGFKPSRAMNVDDVIFSISRMMDKEHPLHLQGGGVYPIFNTYKLSQMITKIKKISDLEFEIHLKEPNSPFIHHLAHQGVGTVYSKEYFEFLKKKGKVEDFDQNIIGSGPFILKRYTKDRGIRMVSNKSYHDTPAKYDSLYVSIVTDSSVRYQKLKAGECHYIFQPSASDFDAIKANKKLKLVEKPGLNISYLGMNTSKKPFDNLFVREAISLALDKKTYLKAIYEGRGKIIHKPLPAGTKFYDSDGKATTRNIAKAKKLLAKAGYPNGFKTTLMTMPVARPYLPNGKKLGELMQSDLAKIGIQVELVTYDWATYLTKSRSKDNELFQLGWMSGNGDADTFMYGNLSCDTVGIGNRARWCNQKYHDLVIKARRISDEEKRKELYVKAQRIFEKENPWVPMVTGNVVQAHAAELKGVEMFPSGFVYLKDVFLE